MLAGFNDGQREFTTEDILAALKEIVPISCSQAENIKVLRQWLETGKARSASFSEKGSALREQVSIPDFGAPPAIDVPS